MSRIDRREFITQATRLAAGTCVGGSVCAILAAQAWGAGHSNTVPKREVDFYKQLPDKRIECFVCPLHCKLNDGETCFCRTRTNYGGKLYTDAYENPCIITTDPIEKLPLNHYLPATKTLTIACGGCNMRCLYCQNWQQSQVCPNDIKTFKLSPQEVAYAAINKGIPTIAFAYTEPVVFLEYAKDIAALAKEKGLKVVVSSAAYIDPEPLVDFAQYVDAFVIGLKGFDDDFYHRVTGGKLEPVKTALETIKTKSKSWLEIVNLVVPGYNDDIKKIGQMSRWIADTLGDEIPVHFARFVPMYKLKDLPRTPVSTIESAISTARNAGLKYVYSSNIAPHKDNHTICCRCGTTIIQRLGFKVLEGKTDTGACPKCRRKLPGVWT